VLKLVQIMASLVLMAGAASMERGRKNQVRSAHQCGEINDLLGQNQSKEAPCTDPPLGKKQCLVGRGAAVRKRE
jgi:hypothetical protein